MDRTDLVTRLTAIPGAVAGSDAERRTARLLAHELRGAGRRPRVQTLWIRPSWAPALAIVCGLSVLGTVVGVDHPTTGVGLCVAALVLFALDISGRLPLLRRLTRARATQNVVALDPREAPVRLVITAAVDARLPAAFSRGRSARAAVALRAALGPLAPGGFGVVAGTLVVASALALLRTADVDGDWLGIAQLVPAAILIASVGIALDHASGDARDGGRGNASACATALALVAALDRTPPTRMAVDVVLAGAGEAHALGMRRWIAARRREGMRAEEVVVVHVAPCGAGRPVWWTREGLVLPFAYHPRLTDLAARVAATETHLGARPTQSRRSTGARAARAVGWPAIAVGCLKEDGTTPEPDGPADPAAMSACLEFTLGLVAALDRELIETSAA